MGFAVNAADTAEAIKKQQELLGKPEKVVIKEEVEPKAEVKGVLPKSQPKIHKESIR